jgi:two-component sensor histidine kinase
VQTYLSDNELDFRARTVTVGVWLGWTAIAAVFVELPFARSRALPLVLALSLAAVGVNAAAMIVPWRAWLAAKRGRVLLDLWSAALIAFVALLVASGGATFALLLFLVTPFIAVVHGGRRRLLWLGVNAGVCALVAALLPLPAGPTAMRLALVAAAVSAAILGARALRREAAARTHTAVLHAEADHRIKNSLQVAGDLLLLSRPDGDDGHAFDEAAARIHSIAVVHRLLNESGTATVDARALIESIVGSLDVPFRIDADPLSVEATVAQKLGIVTNELMANAVQHGAPPFHVRLEAGPPTRLTVDDQGGRRATRDGFGLQLVTRMVEQGLRGRFELTTRADGGTRAELTF